MMLDEEDMTLAVTGYEFMTDEDKTCIGLRLVLRDGHSLRLRTITIPIDPDTALELGAMLIAHSDWLSGRPQRDWSALDVA